MTTITRAQLTVAIEAGIDAAGDIDAEARQALAKVAATADRVGVGSFIGYDPALPKSARTCGCPLTLAKLVEPNGCGGFWTGIGGCAGSDFYAAFDDKVHEFDGRFGCRIVAVTD